MSVLQLSLSSSVIFISTLLRASEERKGLSKGELGVTASRSVALASSEPNFDSKAITDILHCIRLVISMLHLEVRKAS